MKIFISIASYQDPLLETTILSAFNNAKAPENLHFGICDPSSNPLDITLFSFFNSIFILKNGFLGVKENVGFRSIKFSIFQILSKAFEISFLLPEIVPFTPSFAKRIVPLISVVDKIEFNKV